MEMSSMQVKHLDPESSSEATFHIDVSKLEKYAIAISETYSICNNIATLRIRAKKYYDCGFRSDMLIAHMKIHTSDGKIRIFLIELTGTYGSQEKCFSSNTGRWHWKEISKCYCPTDWQLKVQILKEHINRYTDLHGDKDFTDFELRTEAEGTVCVHRNILMMASPVLGKMVLGEWKEAKEGHVQVPGISAATLQHFKDYIYLKQLPDELLDCAKLLSLASYYIMPKLDEDCIARIITFKAKDAWCLFEHFVNLKDARLLVLLLQKCNSGIYENLKPNEDNLKDIIFYTDLHEDTSLIDFELSGENVEMSVFVHRNILAMSSSIFKEKLLGEWKNAKKGEIKLDGDSKDTLQHLKDYIYVKRLPEDPQDCSKLLSLAKMYDIPDLEVQSADFIASKLTSQNFWFSFEYCMQHKAEYLFVKLLEKIHEDNMATSLDEYFSKAN